MKASLLNRLILILSYVGAFIAGSLSLSHALKLDLPCGASGGCEKVNSSSHALWMGVPVAYFGLATYLAIALITTWRLQRRPSDRSLMTAAWGFAAVGTLASGYLTYVALTIIRATCWWCLASAAVMLLLFILHTVLLQKDEEPAPTGHRTDFAWILALPALAAIGVGVNAVSLKKSAGSVGALSAAAKSQDVVQRLTAAPVNAKGRADAPVTIVEFGDFFCGACRTAFPQLQELVGTNPGIRLIYRHYPLYNKEGHETSLLASQLSQIAAEKGKFWEFADLLIGADLESVSGKPDVLLAMMDQLGFERSSYLKRLGKEEDPTFAQVYADLQIANDAGLNITPSFYVLGRGLEPKVVSFPELQNVLGSPVYQELLNPTSGAGPTSPPNGS